MITNVSGNGQQFPPLRAARTSPNTEFGHGCETAEESIRGTKMLGNVVLGSAPAVLGGLALYGSGVTLWIALAVTWIAGNTLILAFAVLLQENVPARSSTRKLLAEGSENGNQSSGSVPRKAALESRRTRKIWSSPDAVSTRKFRPKGNRQS